MRNRLAYNTLIEVKRQLGGGGLPPYEPLTPEARAVMNPEFVAGMGALKADAALGIQCPICGRWYQTLGLHVSTKHREIGGAQGLKQLLGYHANAALDTVDVHEKRHAKGKREYAARASQGYQPLVGKAGVVGVSRPWGKGRHNLNNSCRAQMAEHFRTLSDTMGRQPSAREWREAKLPKADTLYGSWNGFIEAMGGTCPRPWA